MRLKNKIRIVIVTLLAFFCTTAKAQNNNCDCKEVFGKMIEKLETNYIAYHLTKDKIDKTYQRRKAAFEVMSGQTEAENCTKLLQEFLSFFKDGHLFVSEYPKFSEVDLAKVKSYIKENIFAVNTSVSATDSAIEGYWTDGSSKFLITKNQHTKIPFHYVAIVVHAQDASKLGEIKFAVKSNREGTYYTNNYASRYVKITPYKDNTLLSIWGGIVWGRLDSKEAQIFNPVAITFKKLDKNKALLTIPSFLVDAKDLNNVLKENEQEIRNIENLIIDIRG
ncbi:MAG TPA: hypothetical protein VFH08_02375, partial [Chitinophagaceae bacterium]|nr:hypothetical protein [Chitinophagaceae bacterium]